MSTVLPKVERQHDLCEGAVDVTFPDGTVAQLVVVSGEITVEGVEWGSVLQAAILLSAEETA